jgi:hypothetical protein
MNAPNTSSFKPLDPGRIHAADAVEFEYWCNTLGCTPQQLAVVVAEVGEHVTEVRDELQRRFGIAHH